jgi:integrase
MLVMGSYSVRKVRFHNGERISLLIGADGLPLHEVVLFLDRYRRRGRAANTINGICSALALLYRQLTAAGVDLMARLREGKFLSRPELDRVAVAVQFRSDDPGEAREVKSSGNVVSLRSVHPRLKTAKVPKAVAVDPETQGTRIRYIAHFLSFIADYVATELDVAQGDRLRLSAKRELETFKSAAPRKGGRAKVGAREGLSEEEQDKVLDVVRPGSPDNPWVRGYVQERNFVIVAVLLATGMRRGELLGLQIGDVGISEPTLSVLRRADAPEDFRGIQPNTKTNDRVLELHARVMRRLWSYINKQRYDSPAARKHPYIFVADDGMPLSLASIDKIFRDIRLACAGLSVRITSHVMRHTWNERFSEEADRLELSDVTEERARNAQQGWSDNSTSARVYTRRHAAKVGRKVSMAHQEKLSESIEKK